MWDRAVINKINWNIFSIVNKYFKLLKILKGNWKNYRWEWWWCVHLMSSQVNSYVNDRERENTSFHVERLSLTFVVVVFSCDWWANRLITNSFTKNSTLTLKFQKIWMFISCLEMTHVFLTDYTTILNVYFYDTQRDTEKKQIKYKIRWKLRRTTAIILSRVLFQLSH